MEVSKVDDLMQRIFRIIDIRRLFGFIKRVLHRECRHEFHVHWNGRAWVDPVCCKCGQRYDDDSPR